MLKHILPTLLALAASAALFAQNNSIDQVIWVVGDEAIYLSDLENEKIEMRRYGETPDGVADCYIPEQLALQKLFLHQAKLDSIEVDESRLSRMLEEQVKWYTNIHGSREKWEEYAEKSYSELRESLRERLRTRQIMDMVRRNLIGDVKVSPPDVRAFYEKIPADSLPRIPASVEIEIISQQPRVTLQAVDEVKERLHEYTRRVQSGETTFATLALLYSEDKESAIHGGELGFTGRASLVNEFASAAFALTSPDQISNVVETEYGFHIIQLIERRGDMINVRHILLKPKIPQEAYTAVSNRLDTVAQKLRANEYTVKEAISSIASGVELLPEAATTKLSFEEAAYYISTDKNSRNSGGLMVNNGNQNDPNGQSYFAGSASFAISELPPAIARIADTLAVGAISNAFVYNDRATGKDLVAIIKLRSRNAAHYANPSEDYQILRTMTEQQMQSRKLEDWIKKKIKDTYVWLNPIMNDCDFQYDGWKR